MRSIVGSIGLQGLHALPPIEPRKACASQKNAKKKVEPDDLLERLNNHYPNFVFTVEETSDHFLDKKPGKLRTVTRKKRNS